LPHWHFVVATKTGKAVAGAKVRTKLRMGPMVDDDTINTTDATTSKPPDEAALDTASSPAPPNSKQAARNRGIGPSTNEGRLGLSATPGFDSGDGGDAGKPGSTSNCHSYDNISDKTKSRDVKSVLDPIRDLQIRDKDRAINAVIGALKNAGKTHT